jgi:dihydroorotate dehydrogenase electron transfer subunit
VSTAELEPGLSAPEAGPRTLAPFGRRAARVAANEGVGSYRLLSVEDHDGPDPLAGQFYMLSTAARWGDAGGRPHLGRAFSVCRVRERRLEFVLEAIGPGTERLAGAQPGEHMWLVGPLGIGFPDHPAGRRALLVGGGIGVAPLVIWEQTLHARGAPTAALLGFRNSRYIAARDLFASDVALATDDGSHAGAHRGRVTDLLERALRDDDVVYACGPPPMLEAVRRVCAGGGVDAHLALEAGMACGFGACFGCVVRTRDGYRRLCVDGPVVSAADLAEGWE